jgi:4-hydroxy-tetrahydrodipicolinate reductase
MDSDLNLTASGFVDVLGGSGEEDRGPWWSSMDDVEAEVDGVVEFTHGGGVAPVAEACARRGWPLVSGTTGLTREDEDRLKEARRSIPILRAANMSLGIALLRRCLSVLSSFSPQGTELEIVEIHHGGKRDAPSGTARSLFDLWSELRGEGLREVHGRSGQTGARKGDEVGVHALRLGHVVGEHQLHFALPGGERVELIHRVAGRASFARGALFALSRLVGRPPGLYGLDDLYDA